MKRVHAGLGLALLSACGARTQIASGGDDDGDAATEESDGADDVPADREDLPQADLPQEGCPGLPDDCDCPPPGVAQLVWARHFGGDETGFQDLATDEDGNLYLVGDELGFAFVYKVDSEGELVWEWKTTDDVHVRDVFVAENGTLAVAGIQTAPGLDQSWVARFRDDEYLASGSTGSGDWNRNGVGAAYFGEGDAYTLEWIFDGQAKEADIVLRRGFGWGIVIDESPWDQPEGLAVTPNGQFLIGGRVSPPGDQDALVARYTGSGDEVWTRSFHGGGALRDLVQAIESDPSGNALVVGVKSFPGTNEDAWVAKIDPGGELLWEHTFDGGAGSTDRGFDVATDPLGNVLATVRLDPGGQHLFKLSPQGEQLWTRTAEDFGDPFLEPIRVTADPCGNVLFSGAFGVVAKVTP